MSLLIGNSRRRKFLLAAAAIAAGGYGCYRAYNSPGVTRRRKHLLRIFSTMYFCCEAVSQSAESISILSGDLKSFLSSHDDSVPQSLKQAFKLGQCTEFQDTVTVLFASLTRGLLRGTTTKVPGFDRGHGQPSKSSFQVLQEKDADVASEDVACREIREVCITTKRQERHKNYDKEGIPSTNVEKDGSDFHEWEIKSYSSGADLHARRAQKVGVVLDRSRTGLKDGKSSEDLVDKLLSKLFSEPGVSFASAVAGTLAQSMVWAFFDAVNNQNLHNKDTGSSSSNKKVSTADEKAAGQTKILDAISTNPCRMLIAECIQTFISTAVTVYIDKTKDVNFYDDMVAGITNPCHRDPMKDVMTSVCNGAVETFVKTSYNVMFDERNGQNKKEYSPVSFVREQLPCSSGMEGSTSDTSVADAQAILDPNNFQGNNMGGVQSFVDGVSKTLAVPSNRKLVMEIAGTMTSEAVRSFVDVVLSTVSTHFCSKLQGSWEKVKRSIASTQCHQLQERSRVLTVKADVLASVCLALCLHFLTVVHALK